MCNVVPKVLRQFSTGFFLRNIALSFSDNIAWSFDLLNVVLTVVMASFDIESLFTNIPLKKTIGLCVDILFTKTTNVDGIAKCYFHELLSICMSESLVLFDGKFYKQIDRVAMGSPSGPTLANIFLCFN